MTTETVEGSEAVPRPSAITYMVTVPTAKLAEKSVYPEGS
jgi:hypothetical protein